MNSEASRAIVMENVGNFVVTAAITKLSPGPDLRSRARITRAAADAGPGPAKRPVKILIVEDNGILALNMEDALSAVGYDVVGIAASAEDALEIARKNQPDIALMDIRLEGSTDGIDLAIMLLQRYGTRSVFASAHGAPEMKARAVAAQPAGWVTKPYAMSEIIDALTAALAPKRS